MGRTILLVNDHHGFADTVALLLRQEGHTVLQAYDGQTALDLVEHEPPDLVLSDARMPGLDGTGLARALRERGQRMPVVLMSIDSTTPVNLPGVQVLSKPSNVADLLAVVRSALPDAT